MLLDVLKHRRAPKRLDLPVTVSQPPMNRRIPGANVADVTLEVLNIDRVEADDGGEETNVGFCEAGAVVEGPRRGGEVGFDAVEGGEEGCYGGGVGGLGGCDAGFVCWR